MPNKSLFYSSILECSSKAFRNRNIYIKYAYFQSHYMYPFRLLIALWFLKDKGCAIRNCFVDYRMDAFSVFDDPLTRHKKTPNLKRHSISDCSMPCLYRELRKSDLPGVTPVGADAWDGPSRFIGVFVNHQQALLAKLHQALATLELQRSHYLRALTEDALPRGPVGMETDMPSWGSLLEMATR